MHDENLIDLSEVVRQNLEPVNKVWQLALHEVQFPPEAILLTSWPFFNKIIGGFRMREFTILCGATGTGKTAFLANLSANLLTQQVRHFVASVETGPEDFVRRVASSLLEEDINDGVARSKEKISQIRNKIDFLLDNENLILSMIDNRMSLEFLLEKLRIAHDEHGCKIAILDNLNFFLEITKAQDTNIEMDRVCHEIIMFTKRTDMHVILVAHPRKTESGRVLSEFDIKGSSTMAQEAHNVLLFNRMDKKDIESGNYTDFHRELKIAKLRRRGQYTNKRIIYDGFKGVYTEREVL